MFGLKDLTPFHINGSYTGSRNRCKNSQNKCVQFCLIIAVWCFRPVLPGNCGRNGPPATVNATADLKCVRGTADLEAQASTAATDPPCWIVSVTPRYDTLPRIYRKPAFTDFVSLKPCPSWVEWSHWGICSESCGGGVQARSRVCLYGTAGEEGCDGSDTDLRRCASNVSLPAEKSASFSGTPACDGTCFLTKRSWLISRNEWRWIDYSMLSFFASLLRTVNCRTERIASLSFRMRYTFANVIALCTFLTLGDRRKSFTLVLRACICQLYSFDLITRVKLWLSLFCLHSLTLVNFDFRNRCFFIPFLFTLANTGDILIFEIIWLSNCPSFYLLTVANTGEISIFDIVAKENWVNLSYIPETGYRKLWY